VTHLKLEIEREEFSLKQLGNELRDAENEIKIINEQEKENLQAHIVQLDKNMSTYKEQKTSSHHLEKLNTAKIELAVKLREVLSLKRRLDEVPCQSELIQIKAVNRYHMLVGTGRREEALELVRAVFGVVLRKSLAPNMDKHKDNRVGRSRVRTLLHGRSSTWNGLSGYVARDIQGIEEIDWKELPSVDTSCRVCVLWDKGGWRYEQRFSELDVQIQEKFRQTRKCYATYNALLEIKELALKETSLLNSITSQFHEAITNPAGRIKLIDSMEGIVKGTQQEERAKYERLRRQTST
ncbi:hypothetical protein IFM89_004801, partial [Coptis chinensis]